MLARSPDANPMTRKQTEVVKWLSDGHTAAQVAAIMGISRNTVNSYIRVSLDLTGAANSTGLVAFALRKGWIN